MRAPQGPVRYTTNLIRALRANELKAERRKRLASILAIGSLALLGLAVLYAGINIWSMQTVIRLETQTLERLTQRYQKYQAAEQIVDKADVELLDQLQMSGIFWTKKLASLGKHLPEGFTLSSFSYTEGTLKVSGTVQSTQQQEQLIVLGSYLKKLRHDSEFVKTFSTVQLTTAGIKELGYLGFEFIAQGPKVNP